MTNTNRCAACGYNEKDAMIHADHYLCQNRANAPWGKLRRIRRERKKGFRMPANTVYVGRGSKWGNPFMIGMMDRGMKIDREEAVRLYRQKITLDHLESEITQLRGKNLACWCPLDKACHADVLLEIANGYGGDSETTKVRPTAFIEKEGISITDMIDWLEAELAGIEHARIGGVSIGREGIANETMMLAMQDLLETLS